MKSAGRTPGWGSRGSCSVLQKTGSFSSHPLTPEAALATLPCRGAGSWGASALCYWHHSAAPGARPGDPTGGAPESRSCEASLEGLGSGGGGGLSFAVQRRCCLPGHPGATSQVQVQVPSRSRGAKVRARHVSGAGHITAGLAQALRRWDQAVMASSCPWAVRPQVSARSGSQIPRFAPRTAGSGLRVWSGGGLGQAARSPLPFLL